MKKKTGFMLLIACSSTVCFAQQALSTAGGEAGGTGGSVSYTIGQVAYDNYMATEGRLSQGVQQPYEIFIYTDLTEGNDIDLICTAFPNPAEDILLLVVKNIDLENVTYMLYNANGKVLEKNKITGKETTIAIVNLMPAVYYLKVITDQKEIKTFKIMKIK